MSVDLSWRTEAKPWLDPAAYWTALGVATATRETPVAAVHLGALRHNANDLLRRAAGTPLRVATKSLRVRGLIEAALRVPGYRGVLAYTLAEALWLANTIDDVVVGYPSVDRDALARLGRSPELARKVTLMVDSIAHLDFIDSVLPPAQRETIRVCLDLDASWLLPLLGHVGVRRSPVHSTDEGRALAIGIVSRAGFALVGLMAYEAQVAGLGDRMPKHPFQGGLNRVIRSRAIPEIAQRRALTVAAVRQLADLEFVNGGGTGSLESTRADASVTEIAAGSGLFGGHLFDRFASFRPAPAAAFALSVVRKPSPTTIVLHGGGWIASGPPGTDRLPLPVWPPGLRFLPWESAGEVQTPLAGKGAEALETGDRVWLRPTKSGELSEHVNEVALVDGEQVVDVLPTYRGEGRAFL